MRIVKSRGITGDAARWKNAAQPSSSDSTL
jgi:hypothetical protein